MHASGFEFTHRLDVAHASSDMAKLLAAYFETKSSHDPKGTADYYRKPAALSSSSRIQPADFRETLALESAEPAFADHPAHLYLAGKPMLSRFLQSAADLLPYTQWWPAQLTSGVGPDRVRY